MNCRGSLTPAPGPAVPCTLPAGLAWLWSRILFPAAAPVPDRPRWAALLLLLVLPAILLYPCLGFHLFEPDEGRYAQIPMEMLRHGEWIVPRLQGQPYLDKPPLLYWLVMGSYALLGADDWSARLVPAFAVHAAILLTYLLGRRLVGERSAFWGAVLLTLAPGFISVGRLLVLDGLLTLWTWLSILAAFLAQRGERLRRGWWLVAAVACGLGVLTKGPIALVLLVPPLWLHRRLTRTGAPVDWRAIAAFLTVVLLINLPWYLAVSWREPVFLRYFFWEHNVVRFLDPFDHERPVWFYVPVLLAGLLPGTLLAVPFLRTLLGGDAESARQRPGELGYLLLAGMWCVGFFSLSGCKLPTYILPAFPPLALALGHYLAGSRWRSSLWTWVAGVNAFLLLGMAHWLAIPWYARHHSPMGRAADTIRELGGPDTPIVCYPRPCDSVAFYLGREDLRSYRSKDTNYLILALQQQPRTLLLFTHRHSHRALRTLLPKELHIVQEAPLFGSTRLGPEGDCYYALVENRGAVTH